MYRTKMLLAASMAALSACADRSVTGAEPRTPPERVAPVRMAAAGAAVPGMYIVVLKQGADAHAVADAAGARPRHVYGTALNGFAGELNPGQLTALRHNPNVDYIEQDQAVAASGEIQRSAPWNLARIDNRSWKSGTSSGPYGISARGAGVHAYVIDTGIYTAHPDFEGRATGGASFVDDGRGSDDCNGHGTHVAGIIGGKVHGVAKGVSLVGVRVLGCDGGGTASAVIAGINWVADNRIRPAVANLSLGGSYSASLNDAVTRLAGQGVFVTVAAGNDNQNACSFSPASAPAVTTVAAVDGYNLRAPYSNWGSCVDIYAPGSSVVSDWLSNTTSTLDGTSMASPHVAGVAALLKDRLNGYGYGDPGQAWIDTWIKSHGNTDAIRSNPAGTPNLLLFKSML
jgi:subtilisin family serine protease